MSRREQFSAREMARRDRLTRQWLGQQGLRGLVIYASAYGGTRYAG